SANRYEGQGIFVNLADHWGKLPNYQAYLDKVPYGKTKITNPDGSAYGFFNGYTKIIDQGLGSYTPMAIRYDVFQRLGVKVPETTTELLDAARKLKAAYPDSYPVSEGERWIGGLARTYRLTKSIFWDGSNYVYGPMLDNYRKMLTFYNQLYTEKLLDMESFSDNNDTRDRKSVIDSIFIQLSVWYQDNERWNANKESKVVWANMLHVKDPAIGPAWEVEAYNLHENVIGSEATYIKADAKNLDILLKLNDLQYTDEIVRLIGWGIEGLSYTLKPDGSPTLVDAFHKAQNYRTVGDELGAGPNTKTRIGLQGVYDGRYLVDVAPKQMSYINGQLVETSYAVAFPDVPYPDSPMFSPVLFTPPIAFTSDESNANSSIMTAVDTYVSEQSMKFITGELSFSQWDNFVSQIRNLNIQTVLDMYNRKAAAFK
ncbi:MAG: extracellular solute-binding protein, partial [Treponema sp.]|nr:extracellular solute-binding protein [Treponema sp.]